MAVSEHSGWVPCSINGPAADGANGRWLDCADDFVSTDTRFFRPSAERQALDFPENWPAVFKESPKLKSLINKQLRGTRCRVVGPPSSADSAAAACVSLRPLHSFDNALGLSDVLGWSVVKGFLILERSAAPQQPPESGNAAAPPTASSRQQQPQEQQQQQQAGATHFVAIRHYWNAKDGAWLDLTPPHVPPMPGREQRSLLVESERCEKHPSPLTPARKAFAVSMAARLVSEGAMGLMKGMLAADPAELAKALKPPEGKEAAPAAAAAAASVGGASTGGSGEAKRDAGKWRPYDDNARWAHLLDEEGEEGEAASRPLSAAAIAEKQVAEAVEAAKAKAASRTEADEEAERAASLEETVARIKTVKGLTTMTADDLGRFGSAAEVEQERLDGHAEELRRAEERLAANAYTDRWERAADAALLESAEEDRPASKVQDMLRQMMGGRKEGDAEEEERAGMTSSAPSVSSVGDDEARIEDITDSADALAKQPLAQPAMLPSSKPTTTTTAPRAAEHAAAPAPRGGCAEDGAEEGELGRRLGEVEACKLSGNDHFRSGDDEKALGFYERGLVLAGQLEPTRATRAIRAADGGVLPPDSSELRTRLRQRGLQLLVSLQCNRSAALLRLGEYEEARRAASDALVLSPSDVKARRRRAAALAAMGSHRAACDDLAAVWKRSPRSADTTAALAEAWLARAPPLRPLLDLAAAVAGATGALLAALCSSGPGGKAREWISQHESGGAAAVLACRQAACLVDAALSCVGGGDADGAVALLRLLSWIMGLRGGGIAQAEDALLDVFGKRILQLLESESEAVVVASLQLVQAISMRRIANCAWMPESSVLRLYKEGRSGTIRAAAEGALVWLSRHPCTRNWMETLPRERLEPLVLRCRSLHGACRIGKRGWDEGAGWAMQEQEIRSGRDAEETDLCLGDGA